MADNQTEADWSIDRETGHLYLGGVWVGVIHVERDETDDWGGRRIELRCQGVTPRKGWAEPGLDISLGGMGRMEVDPDEHARAGKPSTVEHSESLR